MTESLRDHNAAFDGTIHLPTDGRDETIPLPTADEHGDRFALIACCDCGLVHRLRVGADGAVQVARAGDEEARAVRKAARARGVQFPLRRGRP